MKAFVPHIFRTACLLLAYAFTLIPLSAPAQPASTNVNSVAQTEWIEKTVASMRTVKPDTDSKIFDINDPKHLRKDWISCRIMSGSFLRVSEDQWLYFVYHSAHDDSAIGDVRLAITQDGDVYISYAHACGKWLLFRSDDLTFPKTSHEFLEKFRSSEEKQSSWVRLENNGM